MSRSDGDFLLGEEVLTASAALDLARGRRRARLGDGAAQRVRASWSAVAEIVAGGRTVYGVNTGFGSLCSTKISADDACRLQHNLLRSHSCGVGEAIAPELSRLMLVLKAQALSYGYSGIAPATLERILWHLESGWIPVVPSQGSVGSSGDLAPLSHLFLPLIGEGLIWRADGSGTVSAAEVLARAGLKPLELGPKEGLALNNGTQFIAAHAVAALERMRNCLDCADLIGAMSLEAALGSVRPFSAELHDLRPYDGTRHVARRLRQLLAGSRMVESHSECPRVQDPYSLRCMPQVHGASRHAWRHLRDLVQVEINAVTDNPVVFDAHNTISGGNFHGQPLALPLDYATVACAELGNISDRRTYLLLGGGFDGLPELLMAETGLNSGFMIPQYTSAALVTENKTLCFPASADSVPTSLGQEDHVSMGSVSGRKLMRVIDNLENIQAVELLCAAQAFEFRKPLESSPILEACHALVRERIPFAKSDRIFAADLAAARELVASGALRARSLEVAAAHNIPLAQPADGAGAGAGAGAGEFDRL